MDGRAPDEGRCIIAAPFSPAQSPLGLTVFFQRFMGGFLAAACLLGS